jgi:hypothetical protein
MLSLEIFQGIIFPELPGRISRGEAPNQLIQVALWYYSFSAFIEVITFFKVMLLWFFVY